MNTQTISAYDADGRLDLSAIERAADLLKSGELVAFPTETVYGLGANALDDSAVQKIFEAKGRPSHNPLIVHVSSIDQAKSLVSDWPDTAQQLAEYFWPGPLTLVLKKAALVPDIVTAGGETVALRMPSHPVALRLIELCGFPLAAPSANRSNQLSPTTAAHVMRSLDGKIPMIIDGGRCQSGIESTVLNLSTEPPEILRPGVLSAHFLSEVLGSEIRIAPGVSTSSVAGPLLSPGQLATHYAPKTPLYLVQASETLSIVSQAQSKKQHVAAIVFNRLQEIPCRDVLQVEMPTSPEGYARDLYAVLHHLDEEQRDFILCEMPPEDAAWAGIRDRLSRAGKPLPG